MSVQFVSPTSRFAHANLDREGQLLATALEASRESERTSELLEEAAVHDARSHKHAEIASLRQAATARLVTGVFAGSVGMAAGAARVGGAVQATSLAHAAQNAGEACAAALREQGSRIMALTSGVSESLSASSEVLRGVGHFVASEADVRAKVATERADGADQARDRSQRLLQSAGDLARLRAEIDLAVVRG